MPYSHQDAEKLSREFQYLIGASFAGNNAVAESNARIECIAVTPFDHTSKQRFFLYYLLFDNDANLALAQEYKGLLFDVVVIARTSDDEMVHEDLYSWLGNNKMVSEFPKTSFSVATATQAYH